MLDGSDYSSDSSDEDYKPCGAESDVDEPSGGEVSEESLNSGNEDGKKKQKKLSKKNKSKKTKHSNVEDEAPTDKPTEELNPEENKERIDNLWASFKKDVDSTTAKKPEADSKPAAQEPVKETAKVVEEYEFAGEKVKVTREVPKPAASSSGLQSLKRPPPVKSGGLSGFFSSKKPKLTTLEKSKLDWDGFKKDEGIEEDLKTFNQGKQGFLERKAFLERTDMKQFEIERNLRMGRKNGP